MPLSSTGFLSELFQKKKQPIQIPIYYSYLYEGSLGILVRWMAFFFAFRHFAKTEDRKEEIFFGMALILIVTLHYHAAYLKKAHESDRAVLKQEENEALLLKIHKKLLFKIKKEMEIDPRIMDELILLLKNTIQTQLEAQFKMFLNRAKKKYESFLGVPDEMLLAWGKSNLFAAMCEILEKYEQEIFHILSIIKIIKQNDLSPIQINQIKWNIELTSEFNDLLCVYNIKKFNCSLKIHSIRQSKVCPYETIKDILNKNKIELLKIDNTYFFKLQEGFSFSLKQLNTIREVPSPTSSSYSKNENTYSIPSKKNNECNECKDDVQEERHSPTHPKRKSRPAEQSGMQSVSPSKLFLLPKSRIIIRDNTKNKFESYDLYHIERLYQNMGLSCYVYFTHEMSDFLAINKIFYINSLKGRVGQYNCPVSTDFPPKFIKKRLKHKIKPYFSDMPDSGTERVCTIEVGKSEDQRILILSACVYFEKFPDNAKLYGEHILLKNNEYILDKEKYSISEIFINNKSIPIYQPPSFVCQPKKTIALK